MTLFQLISVLLARWKVMLLIFALTVGVTVAISLSLPKTYTATATVLVDVKSPDPIAGMVLAGMMAPSYMSTQRDIIQSDRVSRRVVRKLRLTENAATRERWQESTGGKGDFEAWLADALQVALDVKPSSDSNIISVNFKGNDPDFAALIANAFVQAYIETALDLRVDPAKQYSTFFDIRAKQARDDFEKAQSRLSAMQRDKAIIATDERLDVENARLNELSAQLVGLQGLTAESSSRRTQAAGRSADSMQDVLQNGLIASLKGDLARQQARLEELNARYGDNHPQVIELKANIAEVRNRIDAETKKVTGGVSVSDNINRQREAEVRASLEAQRAKLLRMKEQRDEVAVLQRDVENAQRVYEGVRSRLNQTNLESQSTQTNLSMLTQAAPPNDPSAPRILLNTALAVFLGAILAIGTALLLELLNRKIRSVEDVVNGLGLSVIGVLPGPDRKRGRRKQQQPVLARSVLGQLPLAKTKGA